MVGALMESGYNAGLGRPLRARACPRSTQKIARPFRRAGAAAMHGKQNASALDPAYVLPGVAVHNANANQSLRHSRGKAIHAKSPQRFGDRAGGNQRTHSGQRHRSYAQRPATPAVRRSRQLRLRRARLEHSYRQTGGVEALPRQNLDFPTSARILENSAFNFALHRRYPMHIAGLFAKWGEALALWTWRRALRAWISSKGGIESANIAGGRRARSGGYFTGFLFGGEFGEACKVRTLIPGFPRPLGPYCC